MRNWKDEEEKIDEQPAAGGLTPEQREAVYQSLAQKYAEAGDMSAVEAAQKRANLQRMGAGIGEGLAMYATAGHGVQPVKFDDMRTAADQRVADAKQARKERMDSVITNDKLGRLEKDRAFEDKTRGRQETEWKDADALKAREDDPASEESRMAQDLAKKMMPSRDFTGMSATQLKKGLPTLEKIYSIEQRKLERQDAINARSEARKDASEARKTAIEDERKWKEEQKQKEVDEKKKTLLNEVEDRRVAINQNLDILDKMIAEKGTWEAMGSHNQDLDRLVDQIATDMAKLMDPSSVARPSEVEQVKQNLVKSGFSNKNSTARDVIKNFKSEVERRADNAYRIRGLEKPGTKAAPPPPAGGMHGKDLP